MTTEQQPRSTPDLFARYGDDLEVGDSFTTKGRTITEADLVNFAALTWDTYPLHVDAEWASKTMFGERIAHGMLVLSYAAGLVPMQPGPIVAFYGMDHPENPPRPYQAHFAPQVVLEPPPSGIARRMATAANMIYSPAGRRGIDQVVREFQPDVAHVHNIYHQLSPSVLRPLAARAVPTVLTLLFLPEPAGKSLEEMTKA